MIAVKWLDLYVTFSLFSNNCAQIVEALDVLSILGAITGSNSHFSFQQSFVGAIAVADLVKTTLGPKGMDKILVSMGDPNQRKAITVTNDGATILSSIHVDNPAAKILIDISKV